ncbi:MAG: SAM-dependent methyltransferase [Flavobacteriaceae bacterium]|jgi:16S rRNA (cytidine1402-2'-O)-methyltransferase|nr:SAM-dependent methyltransferase [Flavobacteriaceae bacterium]MBT3918818.1 SAM-dependent methyltransferase [Flavobacteriaceae bacterium]MBT6705563.1 SAM-dependent methyltransferase [Flavobacteriaceae bacterium]MBT7241852.1 SAM-dependent methyltransferase [Flavobacteriaceae bacterium]|tara:strand:- start:1198 stop:1908 length:711 start_codon:yes stop_codon:yes gene_type:complete
MQAQGNLFLIPCTLGNTVPLEVLPLSVKKAVEEINHFIVEHEKNARAFIKSIAPKKSQPDLHFSLINKYTEESEIPGMLTHCLNGFNIGVLSDAGCPGIADPGAAIVEQAHIKGIKVVPLVGPSSILLAMMASGFNGQNFSFNGYLPIEKGERKLEIKRLERLSVEQNQSQVFIETPYRNNQMLESLINTLHPQTHICVACDITLTTEYIKTYTANNWKNIKVDLHKRPTIFIIQK